MTEVKRIQLKPCEPSKVDKNVKKIPKTYRYTLTLGESNSKTCPEYSFTDLVKNDRTSSQSLDPFGDEDADFEVASLAQRFEAKYGSKALQSGKRKRTQNMDDFYDLGDGYDVDDPFIDNTEAYDEVVPSSMTTLHGGFYINMGKLDFKSTYSDSFSHDTEDDFTSPQNMKKKKKKQVLDSDSEEETGEALTKKLKALKRKKLLEKRESEKKRKKLSNGHAAPGDTVIKKKKKKNLDKIKQKIGAPPAVSSSVTPAISLPTVTANSTPVTSVISASAISISAVAVTASSTTSIPSSVTNSITTTATTSATLSTTTNTTAATKDKEDNSREASSNVLQDSMRDESSSKSGGEEQQDDNSQTSKNTQLPPNVPVALLEAIEGIKKEAKECKEGKQRFFSPEVNRLLLVIELGSRSLNCASRSSIFNHLGEHLPCGKQAIQRRAKKLRESQQEDELKEPMQNLKDAILKVMPARIEAYEAEMAKAKLEAGEDASEAAKEEASTESEGEEKANEEKAADAKKKPKLPRRTFKWTPDIRNLLIKVVAAKMKLFSTCKSRNETAEEYLKAFLEKEVKPIWPQGWMQSRTLFKESKEAHIEFTKSTKKPVLAMRKLASPAPDAAAVAVSTEASRPSAHIAKTESVIEITATNNHPNISNVVINLPNSEPAAAIPLSPSSRTVMVSKPAVAVSKPAVAVSKPAVAVSKPAVAVSKPAVGPSNPVQVVKVSKPAVAVSKPAVGPSNPVQVVKVSSSKPTVMRNPSQMNTPPQKVKIITPNAADSSVIEILDSPSPDFKKRAPSVVVSAASSTKASTAIPVPPSKEQTAVGAQTSPSSSTSPQGRSFMAAFADFVGSSPSAYNKGLPQSSNQQVGTQISKQPELPSRSLLAKTLQLPQKLVPPQQQKVSTLNKLENIQHQKLTKDVNMSQKAAVPSSVVTQNSSWSNVGSIDPGQKSVSSVVSIKNIPSSASSKVPQNALPKSGVSNKELVYKRQSSADSLFPSSRTQSINKETLQPVGKFHSDVNRHAASLTNNGHPSVTSQSKNMQKVTMQGSSAVPDFLQKQQKSGLIVSPSALQNIRALHSSSSSQGVLKLPSSSNKAVTDSHKSKVLSASPTSSLLQGSYSRADTPSPQKSPVSPGNTALSVYEQIQSQIKNLDAMEGQALKNLSLALQFGNGSGGKN